MDPKPVKFRSTKHDGLTLWNGNDKIKFVRNTFTTSDPKQIAFLEGVIVKKPQYAISKVLPAKRIHVIDLQDDEEVIDGKIVKKEQAAAEETAAPIAPVAPVIPELPKAPATPAAEKVVKPPKAPAKTSDKQGS